MKKRNFLFSLLWFASLSHSELELVIPAKAIRNIRLTPCSPTLRGVASYYGLQFDGRIAKDGSVYRHHKMTAASNLLPLGTSLRVCREDRPWRCVQVRVTDTGDLKGRLLDLSRGAANKLGMMHQGLCSVTVRR